MRASAASGSASPGGHAGTMRTAAGGKRGRTMPSSARAPTSVPDVYLRPLQYSSPPKPAYRGFPRRAGAECRRCPQGVRMGV